MKNLARYLNTISFKSLPIHFNKLSTRSSIINYEKGLTKNVIRSFADNKSTKTSTEKSEQENQDKKTKHIYKKKEQNLANDENSDVIRKESHFFREGFSNGIHIREEVSYVCYELPSQERTAESKGKSEEKKIEEKNQNTKEK